LHVQRFADVHAFLDRAGSWLEAREAEHNLIFGICTSLAEDPGFYSEGRPLFATIERDDSIVATAIQTPPWNLVLSEVDDQSALDALVENLAADHGPADLAGVLGPAEHAGVFAARWAERRYVRAEHDMSERIFRLTTLVPPRPAPGAPRPSAAGDRELLIRWLDAFHDEAFGRPAPTDAAAMVDRWFTGKTRTMWLWHDGGAAVSLCGIGMSTPNGFRIGPVYTPPELRGRGYASNLVAWVTQGGLEAGKHFGFLLADLANPTSNHIYEAIGYESIRDVAAYLFEPTS
jgi:hypothetical protein